MAEITPIRFIDEPIMVEFNSPLQYEKTPVCPDRFIWNGETYDIVELLQERHDFERRGKASRNMRPAHAEAAVTKGSLGVGRFHFRVRTKQDKIFDLYYDRAPKDAQHRKGSWFLYRELRDEII
ncbi:MAG: DUF6504 family protein [Chloroflexota bacterium]